MSIIAQNDCYCTPCWANKNQTMFKKYANLYRDTERRFHNFHISDLGTSTGGFRGFNDWTLRMLLCILSTRVPTTSVLQLSDIWMIKYLFVYISYVHMIIHFCIKIGNSWFWRNSGIISAKSSSFYRGFPVTRNWGAQLTPLSAF